MLVLRLRREWRIVAIAWALVWPACGRRLRAASAVSRTFMLPSAAGRGEGASGANRRGRVADKEDAWVPRR